MGTPAEDHGVPGRFLDTGVPVGHEWRHSLEYIYSSSDFEVLYAYWQDEIAGCMAGRGFDYERSPFVDDRIGALLNPINEVAAREFGYHDPVRAITFPDPPDVSPDFNRALFGDQPEGSGCGVRTRLQVFGPVQSYLDELQSAVADLESSLTRFESTAEARELEADWSDCMKSRGYSYERRIDPFEEYAGAEVTSDVEIQTRLADVECDVAVQYTAGRSRSEESAIETWSTANSGVIAALLDGRARFEEYVRDLR